MLAQPASYIIMSFHALTCLPDAHAFRIPLGVYYSLMSHNVLQCANCMPNWTGVALTQAAADDSNGVARARRVSKIMKEKVANLREMRLVVFFVALRIPLLGHHIQP